VQSAPNHRPIVFVTHGLPISLFGRTQRLDRPKAAAAHLLSFPNPDDFALFQVYITA